MADKKKTILDFAKMKQEHIPVTFITAYDFPFAVAAEAAGIDLILVGDSGGMVQLGYQSTNPVTMDEMIHMAKAVRKGAPNTFIVGDMPQGSYEVSCESAVQNALRFIKEAGCDAIKLEGGQRVTSRVKAIAEAGILVMGHLGLTPQSAQSFGGYRVQCKTKKSFESVIEDAIALVNAGAFSVLLEAMPAEPGGQIAKNLSVPIFGIGAGNQTDGQLIIMHDLMGFYNAFRPLFAKCYIPIVLEEFQVHLATSGALAFKQRKDGLLMLAQLAINRYINDVTHHLFPDRETSYPITEEQVAELKTSKYWKD